MLFEVVFLIVFWLFSIVPSFFLFSVVLCRSEVVLVF